MKESYNLKKNKTSIINCWFRMHSCWLRKGQKLRSEPNEISVVLIQFSPTRCGPVVSKLQLPNVPVSWEFPGLQEAVPAMAGLFFGGLSMYYSLSA